MAFTACHAIRYRTQVVVFPQLTASRVALFLARAEPERFAGAK